MLTVEDIGGKAYRVRGLCAQRHSILEMFRMCLENSLTHIYFKGRESSECKGRKVSLKFMSPGALKRSLNKAEAVQRHFWNTF